jgi:4-aminobutyrate aminotransferase-like enzyme
VQLRDASAAAQVVTRCLHRGVLFLQSGVEGDVVSISPPLIVGEDQLSHAIETLEIAIAERTART